MTPKEFMNRYYTHETILKKFDFDKGNSIINFKIEYSEWQLEELAKTKNKGYELIFYNVKNVSNENIFKFHDEFILELKINKTRIFIRSIRLKNSQKPKIFFLLTRFLRIKQLAQQIIASPTTKILAYCN